MTKAQDWNSRVLEVLEQTYPYDAKQMALFVQEGKGKISCMLNG